MSTVDLSTTTESRKNQIISNLFGPSGKIVTVLSSSERKTLSNYDATGGVSIGVTRVIQTDMPGILWNLVALPVTSDSSWIGIPYTVDPDGDVVVSMELANVTGTVPDRNVLGVSNGVLRLGDGLTTNGRLAVSLPSSTMTLIADSTNAIKGYPATTLSISFAGQTTLKGLSIGSTVTSIDATIFPGCTGFTGVLVVPDSVLTIGSGTFTDCTGFSGLILGRSLSSISTNAFVNCNFTGPLVLPDSLISIGTTAFQNCDGFTGDLVLPPNFTTFGTGKEFQNCTGFTGALYLPASIVGAGMVKNNTFSGCTGFTRIYVACNASAVAVGAFTPLTSTSTIYYKEGTTGWGASFDGKTTALWTSYPAPMP